MGCINTTTIVLGFVGLSVTSVMQLHRLYEISDQHRLHIMLTGTPAAATMFRPIMNVFIAS